MANNETCQYNKISRQDKGEPGDMREREDVEGGGACR